MGILDEAIREHLELKRRHGAGDTELRKIEDEAFGPPARPGDAEVAVEAPVPELPEIADDPTLVAAEQPVIQPAGPAEPTEPLPEAVETAEERIEPISEPPGEASIADQPTELYDHDEGEPPAEGAAEDEFFSEQSLSDELDQALDAPEDEQAPP